MENGGDRVDSPPMFKTGLGKSVMLNKSSMSKALSILSDEGDVVAASGGIRFQALVHITLIVTCVSLVDII